MNPNVFGDIREFTYKSVAAMFARIEGNQRKECIHFRGIILPSSQMTTTTAELKNLTQM